MTTALGRLIQKPLTNKSGGAVAQGDVVVIDTTTAESFTTTVTGGYVSGWIAVVVEPNGIANNALGMVAIGPVDKITLASAASIGDLLKTHTVAKQATPHAAPAQMGDFGIALETGTTPAAIIWGAPYQALTGALAHNDLLSVTSDQHHARSHDHGTAGDGQTLTPLFYHLPSPTDLTIATGAITITQSHHRVDTEASAASDDLDTINGTSANRLLILHAVHDARSVVLKHGTGNIQCVGNADITLDDDHDFAILIYNSTLSAWMALMGGAGGAGNVATDVIWDA